jgi:hypothetical protein
LNRFKANSKEISDCNFHASRLTTKTTYLTQRRKNR